MQKVKFSELAKFFPKQLEASKAASSHKFTLYGGAMGGGKLLRLNEDIPTPNGWIKNKDIIVGDYVLGENGKPVMVMGVTEPTEDEAYELFFSDGTSMIAGQSHLWKTMTIRERGIASRRNDVYRLKRKQTRVKLGTGKRPDLAILNTKRTFNYLEPSTGTIRTTKEIAETVLVDGNNNHSIEQPEPLVLLEKNLPISPYTLGAWLGDGTSISGGITGIDKEIFENIERDGFTVTHHANIKSHNITGFIGLIRKYGLYRNKHIPSEYLRASHNQRLALLQGVMDTDGWCDKDGGIGITLKDKRLFENVVELIRTFGIVVHTSLVEKTCYNNGKIGMYHNAKFITTIPVFRLSRKVSRQKHKINSRNNRRYIVDVQLVGKQKMRCIQIANHDGMYIAGKQFIPTHNSYWIRWHVAEYLLEKTIETGLKGIVGGIFCEDYPALKDRHLSKLTFEFPEWLGDFHADHKQYGKAFIAKPQYGSWVIVFRNLDDPSKYKSAEFAIIAVDELTMNSKDKFDFLRTRLRWPGVTDVRFIAGTNPGGIGHGWVKQLWMDRVFEETEKEADQFIFVQSKADDNPLLNKSYYDSLDGLPESMRRAFKDGNWDVFEGQAFTDWNQSKVVVKPEDMPIEAEYEKFMCFDYGFTAPGALYWCAIDYEGNIIVYREIYSTGKTYKDWAEDARDYSGFTETEDPSRREAIKYIVVGVDSFKKNEQTRKSGVEVMRTIFPIRYEQAYTNRHQGKIEFHQRLKGPTIFFWNTCKEAIRTIPELITDKHDIEDVDCGEDHAYDSIRYGMMSRRIKTKSAAPLDPVQQKFEEWKRKDRDFASKTNKRFRSL